MRGSLGVVAALAATGIVSFASAEVIVAWGFDDDTLNPTIGSGTAANVGGTSSEFATGSGGGRGWQTRQYQEQEIGSGTAGVSFFTSTVGFTDIAVSFEHRLRHRLALVADRLHARRRQQLDHRLLEQRRRPLAARQLPQFQRRLLRDRRRERQRRLRLPDRVDLLADRVQPERDALLRREHRVHAGERPGALPGGWSGHRQRKLRGRRQLALRQCHRHRRARPRRHRPARRRRPARQPSPPPRPRESRSRLDRSVAWTFMGPFIGPIRGLERHRAPSGALCSFRSPENFMTPTGFEPVFSP